MTDPRPVHTHIWHGGQLPAWLDGHHHDDHGRPVIHTPDSEARPEDGWWLIGWSDGTVTAASPWTGRHVYGPDGIAARLAEAEAALSRVAALNEQWVKAGPPPLGTPIARWWDRRLVELNNAIHPPTDTAKEQP